jgi:hypothetical protein
MEQRVDEIDAEPDGHGEGDDGIGHGLASELRDQRGIGRHGGKTGETEDEEDEVEHGRALRAALARSYRQSA